ncbi:hypothetical protein BDZ45DRAFT_744773 [Acephala macrosclerotiorum]|nr:hypothetical protein BDZ45DRAFT_744773 [Acephala macrosclerotiorum]
MLQITSIISSASSIPASALPSTASLSNSNCTAYPNNTSSNSTTTCSTHHSSGNKFDFYWLFWTIPLGLPLSYFSLRVVVWVCDKIKELKWSERARKRISYVRDGMAKMRNERREKKERKVAVGLEKKRGVVGVEAIM